MSQMHTVAWADADGTGFSPQDPHGDVPREYWQAAQRMLTAEVVQPPESIRSTMPHPVWTLRRVSVGALGGHWCFSVQGRGGSFGVAGTCEFTFANEADWHPADVWRQMARRAVDRDRDGPGGSCPPPDVDPEQVRGVLVAILRQQGQIGVPGTPIGVAGIIEAVLTRVSPRLATPWIWATCPLQRPESRRVWLIGGRWPVEFRRNAAGLARQIDQVLTAPPDAPGDVLDDRRGTVFDLLVRQAPTGNEAELIRRSQAATLGELLDEIAEHTIAPGVTDVPRLFTTHPERLAQERELVRRWARTAPQDGLIRLRDLVDRSDPHQLRWPLLDGLIDAQWDHPATNPLGLPVSGTHQPRPRPGKKWRDQLAGLLIGRDDETDLVGLLHRLSEPGAILAKHLHAMREWFLDLGLSPWHQPELFPDRALAIVTAYAGSGTDVQHARDELARAPGPAILLREVAARLDGLNSERAFRRDVLWDAARSISSSLLAAYSDDQIHPLLDDPEDRLYRLLDDTRRRLSVDDMPAVAGGALTALGDVTHWSIIHDERLIALCAAIGLDHLSQQVRGMLRAGPARHPGVTRLANDEIPPDPGQPVPSPWWHSRLDGVSRNPTTLLAGVAAVVVVLGGGLAVAAYLDTYGPPGSAPVPTPPQPAPVTQVTAKPTRAPTTGPTDPPSPTTGSAAPTTASSIGKHEIDAEYEGPDQAADVREKVARVISTLPSNTRIIRVRLVLYTAPGNVDNRADELTAKLRELPALDRVPFEPATRGTDQQKRSGTVLVILELITE